MHMKLKSIRYKRGIAIRSEYQNIGHSVIV
jgi:hypothetical protein